MKVITQAGELRSASGKVCVAIGVFDGVHLGHQQVIRQTISDAQQHEANPVIITFDCHPNSVVAPERTPPMIYPVWKKLRMLETLGVKTAYLIHFDKLFSEIPAETFVRDLVKNCGRVFSISVGSTFTFGYKRGGNVGLLKKLGEELHFSVHGLAAVALDGERVSSTRIREAILKGELDAATQMLGRTYSLSGKIVEGDKFGRQLGFPTANLDVNGLAVPPRGVYAIHAEVRGKTHRAVLNIGVRPTLQSPTPKLRVEAHLLDFAEDLYGVEMEITFVEKLREEQKFPSPELLRQHIARDVEAARRVF